MAETNNEALLISLLWVCISIFLADIYIYYLFNKLASLYNQKSQFMMLQQEKNLQTKYYNELENKYTEYRQLAHDTLGLQVPAFLRYNRDASPHTANQI